jgi:hypothetical protein
MNKLLSFDKSAVTNFSDSIYCALSQYRRKYDQSWESYCWLCFMHTGAMWKKLLPQSYIRTPSFGERTIRGVPNYKFNSIYFQFHMKSTITW